MEKEKLHKAIEQELIKEAPKGFSSDVMNKIFAMENQQQKVYQPLISPKVLWGIGILSVLLVLGLFIFVPMNTESSMTSGFSTWLNEGLDSMKAFKLQGVNLWMVAGGIFLIGFLWISETIMPYFQPIKK